MTFAAFDSIKKEVFELLELNLKVLPVWTSNAYSYISQIKHHKFKICKRKKET